MPSFNITVRTNRLSVDAPVLGCEDGVLDPLPFNVVYQIMKGLHLGLNTEVSEHRCSLMKRQEGKGHQLPNVAVNTVVAGISHLEAQLLHFLQRNNEIC